MIASLVDHLLRAGETRASSPAQVARAARWLACLLWCGETRRLIPQLQERRLRDLLAYLARHSPYYRQVFARQHLRPGDIRTPAELTALPLTTGDALARWQEFLCVPADALSAVFTTAGTTGEPKRLYFTFADLQRLINIAAVWIRLRHAFHPVILIAFPHEHGLWIGATQAQRMIELAGGLPINIGIVTPTEAITWMRRFAPTVLLTLPSFATVLTRTAAQVGYRITLETIYLGGEKITAAEQAWLADYWHAEVYDTYGMTELGGAQTLSLPQCTALHLNDLHLVTEILDPETGRPAEAGELVFTTLLREAMPLLRYRSGDLAARAECPCGLPLTAIRLLGRCDDRFVAGGMNFDSNTLAGTIRTLPGATGRLGVEVDKFEWVDRITLRVEGQGLQTADILHALSSAYPELPSHLANGMLLLHIEPNITLVDQLKAIRLLDRR